MEDVNDKCIRPDPPIPGIDPSILENHNKVKGVKSDEAWPTFREFVEDVMAPIIINPQEPENQLSPEDTQTIINQDKEAEYERSRVSQLAAPPSKLTDEFIPAYKPLKVEMSPDGLDPIKLSTEELNRRQEEANAQYAPVQVHHGDVVQVGSMPDTDYIVMTFSDGTFSAPLHRRTAIERAGAVLEMIEAETGSATSSIVDKDVWLCLETLRAAIKNGRSRGLEYNTTAIKNFEKRILRAEKSWRDRSDYKPGPDAPRKVYMGNS